MTASAIHTASKQSKHPTTKGYKQTRLPIRQRNNKGKEATKGYKRTPETTKAKNRRNATSNRGKGGKANTQKAADEKLKRWRDNIPTRGINATREDAEQQRLQETTVE